MGKSGTEKLFSAAEVMAAERCGIIKARGGDPEKEAGPLYGLAISGGGIRSASFGLGVLQGLVGTKKISKGILHKIDYLSTVSGGGYIGSALTWFLHLGKLDRNGKKSVCLGTEPRDFIFGRKGEGARQEEGYRNRILDFIRQHACYLTPGKGLDLVSALAVVARSMFVSLFVYLALITFFMYLLIGLVPWQLDLSRHLHWLWWPRFSSLYPVLPDFRLLLQAAYLLLLGLALSSLLFSLRTYPFLSRLLRLLSDRFPYKILIDEQRIIGWCWKMLAGLVLIGSVPYVYSLLDDVWAKLTAVGLPGIFGTVVGYFQSQKQGTTDPEGKGNRLLVAAAVCALLYGLVLAGFILAWEVLPVESCGWYIILLGLAGTAVGFFVNMNYAGLHRMYRDRLMETFLPNPENVESGFWGPATRADKALLRDMCKDGPGADSRDEDKIKRPYHLINTNLVLVDSGNHKYRGRGGDSYLLSPLYCGSDATCWRKTDRYMNLPTAMAISGAAANPNSGVSGRGATRSRPVSILMTLLNLRLGYWLPNFNYRTKKEESDKKKTNICANGQGKRRLDLAPNYLAPGLFGAIFAPDHREGALFLELSDGGHFENLGIYELIRRRLDLIIVTDGGADPRFKFGDLANAVERVRVDFGAKITFWEDCDLNGLLPGSETGSRFREKFKLARRGHAIADIDYNPADPGKETGTLIYLKTTVTGGLPADIYGYKAEHPEFPDEPTSDQFFDEAQFEAYRELGYQLTTDMLEDELLIAALERVGLAATETRAVAGLERA
ncbi:MAG: patatin-like phospholipase family protein [Desulfobacterales bacterium]|nr:patatin-like phospholipase family protein [Desulfobacterales bacterium]